MILLDYSDCIYLLFNSPFISELKFDKKIKIIDNKENMGISKAINRGVNRAARDNYQYSILFDQDSFLTKDDIVKMFDALMLEERNKKVMCIGPSLNVYGNIIPIPEWIKNRNRTKTQYVYSVNHIITSGMLINVKHFIDVGGYTEQYPIDFCDFLFCWKSIRAGYLVLQSKDVYMSHEIGTRNMKFYGYIVHFHAPYRNYFLVRDTLNVCLKARETPLTIRFRLLFRLPFRMILYLFMLNDKIIRLKMYGLGFKDFFSGKCDFGSVAKMLE
jgi:rhamnosyltransferase